MLFQHTVWKSTCGSSTGVGCFNTGFFAVKLLMGRQINTDDDSAVVFLEEFRHSTDLKRCRKQTLIVATK